MKAYKFFSAAVVALSSLVMSCEAVDPDQFSIGETNVIEEDRPFEIPADDQVESNPTIVDGDDSLLSNISISAEEGYDNVLRINMTGVLIPDTGEWLTLCGPLDENQNIWLEIDDQPRGFTVVNGDEEQSTKSATRAAKSKADIIFLIDNSGSMGNEANSIATEISAWSQTIAEVLDVEFACVGYDDYGNISGALNITSIDNLDAYLNSGYTGTSRTKRFGGDDADELSTIASGSYSDPKDECGMSALRFADENFNFRSGSNRIYINFTDEPNQPYGYEAWSVEFLNNQDNWNTAQGTVHTVYSDTYISYTNNTLYNEHPWLMSEYTGGTVVYTTSSFDMTLDELTVTGAIQNSAILRIMKADDISTGTHTVKLTLLSEENNVKAEKIYENVSFEL